MSNSETVLDHILNAKLIAIVRGVKTSDICQLTQALLDGGITCMEVTYNQKSIEGQQETLHSIRTIKQTFGDAICLGAGTVLTPLQVQQAIEAGAAYMISPNVDLSVIAATKKADAVSIPGALTPSEIVTAYSAGADIVKLFPAGDLGIDYIRSLIAPLSHIPLSAVGGVRPDNVKEFFSAGVVGVGIGSNLVSLKDIREKRFDRITETAKKYVAAISGPCEC